METTKQLLHNSESLGLYIRRKRILFTICLGGSEAKRWTSDREVPGSNPALTLSHNELLRYITQLPMMLERRAIPRWKALTMEHPMMHK